MNLEELRNEIDKIDDGIVELLAKRIKIVENIGQVKIREELATYQPEREKIVLEKLKIRAKEYGFEDKFIDDLYKLIFTESKKIQERNAKGI